MAKSSSPASPTSKTQCSLNKLVCLGSLQDRRQHMIEYKQNAASGDPGTKRKKAKRMHSPRRTNARRPVVKSAVLGKDELIDEKWALGLVGKAVEIFWNNEEGMEEGEETGWYDARLVKCQSRKFQVRFSGSDTLYIMKLTKDMIRLPSTAATMPRISSSSGPSAPPRQTAPNRSAWDLHATRLLQSLAKVGDTGRGADVKCSARKSIQRTVRALERRQEQKKMSKSSGSAGDALKFYRYALERARKAEGVAEGDDDDDEMSSSSNGDDDGSEEEEEQSSDEESSKEDEGESETSSLDSEDFFNQHNDVCEVCGLPGEVICCATCTLVFHQRCHRPILKVEPADNWSCAYCDASGVMVLKNVSRHRRRAANGVKEMAKMTADIRAQKQEAAEDKERGVQQPGRQKKDQEKTGNGETFDGNGIPGGGGKDGSDPKPDDATPKPDMPSAVIGTEGQRSTRFVGTEMRLLHDQLPPNDIALDKPRGRRQRKAPKLYVPGDGAASERQKSSSPLTCIREEPHKKAEEEASNGGGRKRKKDLLTSRKKMSKDKVSKKARKEDKGKTKRADKKTKKNQSIKANAAVEVSKNVQCIFCYDDASVPVCCFCSCRVCFFKGDTESTLLCDSCDAEYHMFCLKPPLLALPKDDEKWFCPTCIKAAAADRKAEAAVGRGSGGGKRPEQPTASRSSRSQSSKRVTPTRASPKRASVTSQAPSLVTSLAKAPAQATRAAASTTPGTRALQSPRKEKGQLEAAKHAPSSDTNTPCTVMHESIDNLVGKSSHSRSDAAADRQSLSQKRGHEVDRASSTHCSHAKHQAHTTPAGTINPQEIVDGGQCATPMASSSKCCHHASNSTKPTAPLMPTPPPTLQNGSTHSNCSMGVDEKWASDLTGRSWEIFWDDSGDDCVGSAVAGWYDAEVKSYKLRRGSYYFEVEFEGDRECAKYEMNLTRNTCRPSVKAWMKRSQAILCRADQTLTGCRDRPVRLESLPPSTATLEDQEYFCRPGFGSDRSKGKDEQSPLYCGDGDKSIKMLAREQNYLRSKLDPDTEAHYDSDDEYDRANDSNLMDPRPTKENVDRLVRRLANIFRTNGEPDENRGTGSIFKAPVRPVGILQVESIATDRIGFGLPQNPGMPMHTLSKAFGMHANNNKIRRRFKTDPTKESQQLYGLVKAKEWSSAKDHLAAYPNDTSYKDSKGRTVLHEAVVLDAPAEFVAAVVKLAPALPLRKSDNWDTPLSLAIRHPAPSTDIIKALTAHYPGQRTTTGWTGRGKKKNRKTLLHLTCDMDCSVEIIVEMIRAFPHLAMDPDETGNSCLHIACSRNLCSDKIQAIVNLLPGLCSKVNSRDETPLHIACYLGDSSETIDILKSAYPEALSMYDKRGCTCSTYASLNKDLRGVDLAGDLHNIPVLI